MCVSNMILTEVHLLWFKTYLPRRLTTDYIPLLLKYAHVILDLTYLGRHLSPVVFHISWPSNHFPSINYFLIRGVEAPALAKQPFCIYLQAYAECHL